jgi:NitT/TauT family transport system permease protein
MSGGTARTLAPWIATLGLFVMWEAACRLLALPEFILPTPSASLAALWEHLGAIWFNASFTLWVTLLGFALAVVFGLALGVLIGASALMYAALYPLLIGFNSIPKVAIVPILVIWFGIGAVPAVLTAFLISFFPIVVNVATGLATLEPELRDVLRSLGARPRDILLKVGLPRSMPYFFASLKVAVTLALRRFGDLRDDRRQSWHRLSDALGVLELSRAPGLRRPDRGRDHGRRHVCRLRPARAPLHRLGVPLRGRHLKRPSVTEAAGRRRSARKCRAARHPAPGRAGSRRSGRPPPCRRNRARGS